MRRRGEFFVGESEPKDKHPVKRPHSELKREVMRACNRLPGVYIFPYSAGGFQIHTRFVKMGMQGVSDLIGWSVRRVHLSDVCTDRRCDLHVVAFPRFVALEIKVGRDKLSPLQKAFLDQVKEAGGIAYEIRSVEEAVKALS